MKMSRILMTGIAAVMLAACAGPSVKLGNITSTDQVDLTRGETLTASASGFQLLLFIPIATNGRQERAMESILAQAGDRLVGNVKVTESWSYGLVGTTYTTTIEATAYPRRKGTQAP